jgi:hypothetical protein
MAHQQKQRHIEHFFKSTTDPAKRRSDCRLFFVDWTQLPYRAEWRCESDNAIVIPDFECEVVWKELGRVIVLQCVLPTVSSRASVDDDDGQKTKLYRDKSLVSLLKSNLQKCVRRQLPLRACQTARYLMELDVNMLVRRLAIIMLEDVVLHESFGPLVWLTAALSKGFRMTRAIKEWLLGLVDHLCREPREQYWSLSIDNTPLQLDDKALLAKYRELGAHPSPDRDTGYSLLFRMSYGGLAGDLAMMFSFIDKVVLAEHTGGDSVVHRSAINPIALDDVQPLALESVENSAVDFHCAPHILLALDRQHHQLYTQQQIKRAIWHHSSKYNKRVVYPQSELDAKNQSRVCFLAIAKRLVALQQDYIRVLSNEVANAQYKLDLEQQWRY